MLSYHLSLALASFRMTPVVSLLSCLALTLGIAACMTMITVRHAMAGDPFPEKSNRIFHVQVDTRIGPARQGEPLDAITFSDAHELLTLDLASRHEAASFSTLLSVKTSSEVAQSSLVRGASADFFGMFNIQFESGTAWSTEQDRNGSRVAVLSSEYSRRFFGNTESIGKSLEIGGKIFTVIGVIMDWRPVPRFFDLSNGAYSKTEGIFIPITAAISVRAEPAYMECWGEPGPPEKLRGAPCGWLHFWVELESANQREFYEQQIISQLREFGLDDPSNRVRVIALPQWLTHKEVVPKDITLQTVLALAFLVLCAVNMSGLLMMKYLDRSKELAIRMALGASRKTIAGHVISESLIIGLTGTLLGVGGGCIGVYLMQAQPFAYAEIIQVDPLMILTSFVIGIAATLMAAALAIWRVGRVSPSSLIGQ